MVGRKPVILIPNKKKFLKHDKGGAIYRLKSSPAFASTTYKKNYQFGRYEWISRRKVKPIGKKTYDSSIDAMIDNGAIVYFVTPKQMARYNKITDDETKPVKNSILHKYFLSMRSENEKRGGKKRWWKK